MKAVPYIGKIDDHVYGDWVMHDVYQHNALLLIYALITTTIRRAFDGHSTAYQTSLSHTDVYMYNSLGADTLTYLFKPQRSSPISHVTQVGVRSWRRSSSSRSAVES